MAEIQKYFIRYGLGNTMEETDTIEAESVEKATDEAYYLAKDRYDSYAGLHGIPSYEEVCEEHGLEPDTQEADEAYEEEKEDWVNYEAELYRPEIHDDYL